MNEAAMIRKAQGIVLNIWAAWYGRPDWTPQDNLRDLLLEIDNALQSVPEYARASDAALRTNLALAAAIPSHGERDGGEG